MSVIEVTSETFKEEVLESKMPVLADFNADWCGPCRMLKPILDEIAEDRTDVKIVSINIDEEDDLACEYGVSSIPCVVLFKDGKEETRSIGLKPKDEFESMIG